jgi:hypothetical protein
LWFGGETMHERLLRRLVEFGSGFNPLGRPSDEDLERLLAGMAERRPRLAELEMVGGHAGRFAARTGVADLGEALASIPAQLERGFVTICIKPSQFIDDPREIRRSAGGRRTRRCARRLNLSVRSPTEPSQRSDPRIGRAGNG